MNPEEVINSDIPISLEARKLQKDNSGGVVCSRLASPLLVGVSFGSHDSSGCCTAGVEDVVSLSPSCIFQFVFSSVSQRNSKKKVVSILMCAQSSHLEFNGSNKFCLLINLFI